MAREMRDSGIEWIGEIPSTWSIQRMKNCIASRQSGAWGDDATGETGDAICLRIADFDYARFRFKETPVEELTVRHYAQDVIERLKLAKGDILIEKSGGGEKTPVGRTVIFDKDYTALYANFMDCLRCTSAVYPQFMQYVFVTFYKNDYSRNYIKQTTGIQNLDLTAMLATEVVATPPIDEQICIASFLDRKCAEIDSAIADTQRTIEEYKKLKQTIITEAVTKGIRGERPMKDSGIEWIGEIPEDWDIKKGKWILSLLDQPVFQDDGVITCFRDGEVTLRSKRREDGFTISLQEAGYQGINVGDLVVHGMDGFAGAIGISDSRGKGTPVLNVLDSTQNKRYIMYYLRSMAYNGVFLALATGIRVRSCDTNWNKLKELPYPKPSIDEQEEIASFIDNNIQLLDELIEKKETLLIELESYKKSVIYEYVTGKKEVPACQ